METREREEIAETIFATFGRMIARTVGASAPDEWKEVREWARENRRSAENARRELLYERPSDIEYIDVLIKTYRDIEDALDRAIASVEKGASK